MATYSFLCIYELGLCRRRPFSSWNFETKLGRHDAGFLEDVEGLCLHIVNSPSIPPAAHSREISWDCSAGGIDAQWFGKQTAPWKRPWCRREKGPSTKAARMGNWMENLGRTCCSYRLRSWVSEGIDVWLAPPVLSVMWYSGPTSIPSQLHCSLEFRVLFLSFLFIPCGLAKWKTTCPIERNP